MSPRQLPPRPDDSFVETSLAAGGVSTRKLLTLVALCMLALAVIVGAAVVVNTLPNASNPPQASRSTSVATLSTIAVSTPYLSPTPLPTIDTRNLGWQAAGPANAQIIAFAPDGHAVYLCGVDATGSVYFSVSLDVGKSWQTDNTTMTGGVCQQISIDPVHPQHIAVMMYQCAANCGNPALSYYQLFLSADGGQTWHAALYPDGSSPPQGNANITWAGDTLWLAYQGKHILAKSNAGQQFTWVDPALLSGNNSPPVTTLLAWHSSIFVMYAPSISDPLRTIRSDDTGTSWHQVTFTGGNAGIVLQGNTADGKLLWGTQGSQVCISNDGAKTWQTSPDLPSSTTPYPSVIPDGTAFNMADISTNNTIFTWMSGSSAWKSVATLNYAHLVGVSWDAQGHPTALWASPIGESPSLGFIVKPFQG